MKLILRTHWWLLAVFLAPSLTSCRDFKGGNELQKTELNMHEVNLASFFPEIDSDDATFVAFNPISARMIRYNAPRSQRRFIHASTFKIPNSLIALETGVADGPDHLIKWNGEKPENANFWAAVWSQDHTLGSAIKHSVYWYYQEIARKIGTERMQGYLNQFRYGNKNLGGGLDQFWLHGDLRISPSEQVQFLAQMYYDKLGLSKHATDVVKEIIVLKETDSYSLSGKTGTVDLTPTREMAWLVGYLEQDGDVWFYALNMEGESVWEQWGSSNARVDLVLALLHEVGVLLVEGQK